MTIQDISSSEWYDLLECSKDRIWNQLRKEVEVTKRICYSTLNMRNRNILSKCVFTITSTIAETFSGIE